MAQIAFSTENEAFALHGCLALQHGLGYGGFSALVEWFSSPEAVYQASEGDILTAVPKLKPETVASIRKGPDLTAWQNVARRCTNLGIRILIPGSPGYPAPLLSLTSPPPLLFAQGEWLATDTLAVAMVGTRNPTAYGRKAAYTLAKSLAENGAVVVSGLALGIDAASHAGALEGGGRTLAVIGCGLDVDYPQANRSLRERIPQSGAIFSEFAPGEPPRQPHFPRRNRILSGLARATVVVEAGTRSGALITAAYARAQGKELFAVPGPIFSPASEGAHGLLRNGAKVAISAVDIVPHLDSDSGPKPIRAPSPPPAPEKQTARQKPAQVEKDPVLELWRGEETCALDSLSERARLSGLWPGERILSSLLPSLLHLEIRGLVQRLPGPAFRRVTRNGLAAV